MPIHHLLFITHLFSSYCNCNIVPASNIINHYHLFILSPCLVFKYILDYTNFTPNSNHNYSNHVNYGGQGSQVGMTPTNYSGVPQKDGNGDDDGMDDMGFNDFGKN